MKNAPSRLTTAFQSLALAFGIAATAHADQASGKTLTDTIAPKTDIQATEASNIYFVQLDNRWYDLIPVGPNNHIASTEPYMGFVVPGAVMENCHDIGTWQPYAFWYGPSIMPIFEIETISYTGRYYDDAQQTKVYIIGVKTRSGNVICDHEVPNPWPDQLFRNGFDGAGTQHALKAPTPKPQP